MMNGLRLTISLALFVLIALVALYMRRRDGRQGRALVDHAVQGMRATADRAIAKDDRTVTAHMTVYLDAPARELEQPWRGADLPLMAFPDEDTPPGDWETRSTPLEDIRAMRELMDEYGHTFGCASFRGQTCNCKPAPVADDEFPEIVYEYGDGPDPADTRAD